jgi:hypothetical protein
MESGDDAMDNDRVRNVEAAALPVADAPSTNAANSYRCYFTGVDDRIQTYEQMECKDDAGAALKAHELLIGSRFASAEVWQGKRFVGKWGNVGAASPAHPANTRNST